MSDERIQTFEAFWPYYVGEHRLPMNRMLHCVGTLSAVLAILSGFTNPWLFLAAPVAGYGAAWIGHFVLEKNRPATFTYPLFSVRGDFKMCGLMLMMRMDAEVERLYGSSHPAKDAPLLT